MSQFRAAAFRRSFLANEPPMFDLADVLGCKQKGARVSAHRNATRHVRGGLHVTLPLLLTLAVPATVAPGSQRRGGEPHRTFPFEFAERVR
jgi:hypothetical protein